MRMRDGGISAGATAFSGRGEDWEFLGITSLGDLDEGDKDLETSLEERGED